MAQIEIKDLTFFYPDMEKGGYLESPALKDISLGIERGEFVLLCGKTGCGKSTFLKSLKPSIRPKGRYEGCVLFQNVELDYLTEREQVEKIGFVMQNPDNQIVTDKVWHELAFGLENLGYRSEEIRLRTAEIAEYFEIMDLYFMDTDKLSGGQKQLLNLAAVLIMNPDVLILDEPTSQLDPIAAEKFISSLKKINEDFGITIILSEHRVSSVMDIADKVIVMDDGKVIRYGDTKEVVTHIQDEDLGKLMPIPTRIFEKCYTEYSGDIPISIKQGREWIAEKTVQDIKIQTIVGDSGNLNIRKNERAICCQNVWYRYEKREEDIVKGLNFTVKKGEIFAILGGNGTGKTTTMWLLSGVKKPYRGKIHMNGKVALLPQNVQNLFYRDSVGEELEGADKQLIRKMGLNSLQKRHPYDISGGQQQKVAIAKVLMENPDILLLDEPTKAIDGIYKEELGKLLVDLKNQGKTIIIVSHDLDFCGEYADRCGLFANGNLIAVNRCREFFAGNRFYTTTVSKMAGRMIQGAVKMEDVVCYMKSIIH